MGTEASGIFTIKQTNINNPAPNKCELDDRVARQDTVPYIII